MAACQLIYFRRRFSGYWFAPRGPILSTRDPQKVRQILTILSQALREVLPLHPALFYRFEPLMLANHARGAFPRRFRRQHAMSPATTVITDVTQSDDALLGAMHEKTRYNIRVSAKQGIHVRLGTHDDMDAFIALMRETSSRDAFTPHEETYLRATYDALASSGMARIRIAEYHKQPLAANMEMAFGDTVTYLHGASSSTHRHAMAPYALHWDALRAARDEGWRFYDWWGCNPDRVSNYYYKPSWQGITRFKRGWGGEFVEYAGTWDLPLQRFLYRLAFPQFWLRG